MKSKNKIALLAILLSSGLSAQSPAEDKGLKTYYKDYFTMGVAVTPQSVEGPEAALILKNFGSVTAENAMKIGPIHPEENRFNWEPADKIVNFAQANGLKMRGHTLCWHSQTPDWLFRDKQGNPVSKEELLKRLKEHIQAVVGRYKGKIYAWDVVNEVINDDNSQLPEGQDIMYRKSSWYKICGEEFIAKAFEYAHEADPNALLFYNDYNTEVPFKRERIYQMLKKMVEAKVPIHGVGLQGHWNLTSPDENALKESIAKFSSLGLKIQITELDVSVYPSEKGQRARLADESDEYTPEKEQQQLEQYKMFFKVFRENKNVITGITFWNVSDKHTWLDNFPVRGRKNYPLLFDQNLMPKKAYWEVVKF